MTVSTIYSGPILTNGNGVTRAFTFPHKLVNATDLVVKLQDAEGGQTLQTLNTHYFLTGHGPDSTSATVTFVTAPPIGMKVRRERATAPVQESDFVNADQFDAAGFERGLDVLTTGVQEVKARLTSVENQDFADSPLLQSTLDIATRTLRLPASEGTVADLGSAASRRNKFLMFEDNLAALPITVNPSTVPGVVDDLIAGPTSLSIDETLETKYGNITFMDPDGRVYGEFLPDGTMNVKLSLAAIEASMPQAYVAPSAFLEYDVFNIRRHPNGLVATAWEYGAAFDVFQPSAKTFTYVQARGHVAVFAFMGQSNTGSSAGEKLNDEPWFDHLSAILDSPTGGQLAGSTNYAATTKAQRLRPATDFSPFNAHFPATCAMFAHNMQQINNSETLTGNAAWTAWEGGEPLSSFTQQDGTITGHHNFNNSIGGVTDTCDFLIECNRTAQIVGVFMQGEGGPYPLLGAAGDWTTQAKPIFNTWSTSLLAIQTARTGFSTLRPPIIMAQTNAQKAGGFSAPHYVEIDQYNLAKEHLTFVATSAPKAGGNTGNGTCTANPDAVYGVRLGDHVVTFATPTDYSVVDPSGKLLGAGVPGTPFTLQGLTFTITAGTTPFIAGDGFVISVASNSTILPSVSMIPMYDLPFATLDDNVHTSGVGRYMWGERIAWYTRRILASKQAVTFFDVKSITVVGNNLVLDLINPTARVGDAYLDPVSGFPTAIDTEWVQSTPNYGFALKNVTNGAVITGVTLTGLNQITIACSITPSGPSRTLDYAMTTDVQSYWPACRGQIYTSTGEISAAKMELASRYGIQAVRQNGVEMPSDVRIPLARFSKVF